MISLIEKRLQELEQRIPAYDNTISELKKKLEEVTTFSKDIDALEKKFKLLADTLLDNVNRVDTNLSSYYEAIKRHETAQENIHKAINALQGEVGNSKSSVDGIAESLKRVSSKYSEHEQKLFDQAFLVSKLTKESAEHEKGIKDNSASFNSVFSHIAAIQQDVKAVTDKAMEHDHAINKHESSYLILLNSTSQLNADLLNIIERFNALPAPSQPKSYDTEFADLRYYIDARLSNFPKAEQPDLSKINDKIKAMEFAIAKIFELFKNNETK